MTNDIHAAAERWKRFKDGEKLQTIYPDHGMKIESLGGQLLMDQSTVLDFVLSLLDDTPITEEWLITQEGVTHDDDWISIWGVSSDDEMKYPVFIWERAEFQQMSGPVLKSRGAVRALLLAMGVSNGEK